MDENNENQLICWDFGHLTVPLLNNFSHILINKSNLKLAVVRRLMTTILMEVRFLENI